MATALTITRTEHSAAELRAFAGRCHDGAQVRRLLALALVLEGCPRTQAAEQNGMDRQTLRDWVHRFNEFGADGLKSRHGPGFARADRATDGGIEGAGHQRSRSGDRQGGALAMR